MNNFGRSKEMFLQVELTFHYVFICWSQWCVDLVVGDVSGIDAYRLLDYVGSYTTNRDVSPEAMDYGTSLLSCYIYAYLCVYCVSIMYMYLCFIEQTEYICGASIVIWFVLIYLCIYYVSVLIEQTEYIYVVCI